MKTKLLGKKILLVATSTVSVIFCFTGAITSEKQTSFFLAIGEVSYSIEKVGRFGLLLAER